VAVSRVGRLVGRERELRGLRRAVDGALGGRGGLVLVSGEPGIGKTRLVAEAVAAASAGGARTAWGSCLAAAPPYWPWRQVLRALDAGDVVPALGGGDPPPADEGARFRLFESVGDRLRALGAEQPLVLALDDLQWADAASVRLLGVVARGLHTQAVLLLGTYRDAEVAPGHPVADLTGELGAALSVVPLHGLDVGDVELLLEEWGGGGRVGRRVAAEVHARTRGNPFFVREVAHLLGQGDAAAPAVPPAVEELVRRQLAGCSPACEELVAAAAVAGSAAELGLLAAVRGGGAVELIGPAEEARARRILEAAGAGYRFRHDLVREAVLAQLPGRRRAELHWALGDALERLPGEDRLEEAASHQRKGVVAGDAGRAAATALRAARQAMAACAFERAVDHLAWVLDRAGDGAATVDEVEVLLLLGDARLRSGDWASAGDAFERAALLARSRGRLQDLGRAALGFGVGLGGFEVRLHDQRQIGLLEDAAALLADADSVVGAFVLARLSVALSYRSDPGRREELAGAAIAMAERTGDPAARAHALAAWCDVISGPADTERRLEAGADIVRLGREAGADELVLLGHRFRVVALLELGDVTGAEWEAAAFERVADRYRLPIVRWYVPLWRGMRALLRGDLAAAERHAAEAAAIGAEAGSGNAAVLAASLRVSMAHSGGELPPELAARLRADAESLLASDPGLCVVRASLLGLAILEDDLAEMRRHLDALVAFGFGERDSEWLSTLCLAALACLALGDAEAGGALHELLAPFEERFVVVGIGAAITGWVGEVLGGLDRLGGRPRQAEARTRAAIDRYERIGAPLLAARARGHTLAASTGGPRPGVAAAREAERGVFRQEGDGWVLGFRGRQVRLRDAKGLRDLAVLLARPGREVHVFELTGGGAVAAGAETVIDEAAKTAYRTRIAELEAEVADAGDAHDPERAASARQELDFLVDELARTLGLGGRARRVAGDQERARQAVRARIRHVLGRVAAAHPELARHLEVSVRTGTFCVYRPDQPVRWQLSG
jgi:AAA ATPase domain